MRIITAMICAFGLAFTAGCDDIVTERSGILHDNAMITQVIFVPPQTTVTPAFDMDMEITIDVDTEPARYAVIFQGERQKFTVTSKAIYDKFKDHRGKKVDVMYREVFRVLHETDGGVRRVVSRELVRYEFADASLK